MVFRFMQSLFVEPAASIGKYDEALIQAAIERVVDGTDPRLRAVGNYQRKLRDAVEYAVDYVDTLVDSLPSALDVDTRRFTADPRLRAFFVSADHVRETLGYSRSIRAHIQKHPQPRPAVVYATLGMERIEKTVLGMELQGEVIKRDVPRVAVNFSGHRIVFPSHSEKAARWELKKRAFDHLIETVLQRLVSIRARRQQLERQLTLYQKKAKTFQAGNPGLQALLNPSSQEPTDWAGLEQQMREIEAELISIRTDFKTIEHYLAEIAKGLQEAEQHLQVEHLSLNLDHMNYKATPGSKYPTNKLGLEEALLGNKRRLVIQLIRFPSDALPPPANLFETAGRYLF
ncbi:MAG: hypothetical protein V2J55_21010 [Candidatus Competibacteraceae bacterium]|jgi:hypothetical protein|nr:hypothetical protein [Candidatus Competibacteraceae bacterium]